jgi:hypothetical protein
MEFGDEGLHKGEPKPEMRAEVKAKNQANRTDTKKSIGSDFGPAPLNPRFRLVRMSVRVIERAKMITRLGGIPVQLMFCPFA